MKKENIIGKVRRVNGPVVMGEVITSCNMLDTAQVGEEHLIGEIVKIEDAIITIQVYEDTTLIRPDDPIYGIGMPLSVELGPGLLGNIFDGIQRPLEDIQKIHQFFIKRGTQLPALDRKKKWSFAPLVKKGENVKPGTVLGTVQETKIITHRIILPSPLQGKIKDIKKGEFTVEETIARVETETGTEEISMLQKWPIRKPRPVRDRVPATAPLITGQRVIDTLFPVAKGGCCAVPGGFGTGKTLVQQQLAKWSNADIIVYIGCGERGNEMTDVLLSFPELKDPASDLPLMNRTILIANTSNMPVAAREASIYTGITIAEYYRDMGYDVAVMADSTSRWAEALRELSGRMEEMPAEEGFPPYLATRLAEFYERAGKMNTLSGQNGSVTIIGAVSPPGGDFSEPVTQHTKRFIRTFWALDRHLANERHYPAISWIDSYSEYLDTIGKWWDENIDPQWSLFRSQIMELLQKEVRLQQVIKLVGADALPDSQKFIVESCRMFKNAFLQQNAFDQIDMYSTVKRQLFMLKIIVRFYQHGAELLKRGFTLLQIKELDVYKKILRMKFNYSNDELDKYETLLQQVERMLS
ncbi:MAG: V-type ATP synthase subunit A [Spirochaetes bacterium]|nr:V-type ATP synthase subunit A [Spirochaetota bacterium]